MTTLTGSALLALAHARGHLAAEEAWAAAHVDEDWQISRWGEDAEASRPPCAPLGRDAGREPAAGAPPVSRPPAQPRRFAAQHAACYSAEA